MLVYCDNKTQKSSLSMLTCIKGSHCSSYAHLALFEKHLYVRDMAQEGSWDDTAIPKSRGFVYAYENQLYNQRLSVTCSSSVYVYNLFYLSIWYQEEWPGPCLQVKTRPQY